MTVVARPLRDDAQESSETFQTRNILTIVGGHFVHDMYPSFVPSLLPLIIERLSLTLTEAGWLSVVLSLPSLSSFFIGWLADRLSVRYLVIFMPAVTGTLVTILGWMPDYAALVMLLFVTGISVSAFHAPAPAMVARLSGRQLGKGMGFFMASGELGRAVGPLLAAFALTQWGLEGMWRVMIFGWLASVILYLRLRNISARPRQKADLRAALPHLKRVFAPLLGAMLLRSTLVASLSFFLTTLLVQQGYELGYSQVMLAVFEFAGVPGALIGGMLSDRIGRKRTVVGAILLSSGLLFVFLNTLGTPWLLVPILIPLGFTALSVTPVLQAVVQEHFPNDRATASGLFIVFVFLTRAAITLLISAVGDAVGLYTAMQVPIIVSLLAIPMVLRLPDPPKEKHTR